MVRGTIKKPGPKPRYDRDEILRGFRLGLSNVSIAEIVGRTSGYVWEIRMREERKKKRMSGGRVC